MKRLIRILVPESPWCANAAAWSALAVLTADAALLLLRVGASVWRKVETWRLLHGLEPVVDPGFAGEPPYAVVTVSFSVVSSATLFAVALLGAAQVLHVLSDLRVPDAAADRPRPRGGATALAAALGGALVLGTLLLAVFRLAGVVAPLGGSGWSLATFLFTTLESLAAAVGLAVLPFCLMRLSGRRFAAPPAGSPEDAEARRAEAWLSIALAGGVAALAADAAWTVLGWFLVPIHGMPASAYPATLLFSLVQPVLALCVLAAVRDALRWLLAGGALPPDPGGRGGPLAAVVAMLAASAVLILPLLLRLGADFDGDFDADALAGAAAATVSAAAIGALFVFCAALLRRLPVPPGRAPAPPPPAFAGPARAWTGLALGLAAIVLALFAARAASAACLAAAFALCLAAPARRARRRVARIGGAAAALALVCLAFNTPVRFGDGGFPAEPRPLADVGFDWSGVALCVSTPAAGGVSEDRWIDSPVAWTAEEQALLRAWAATMDDASAADWPDSPSGAGVSLAGDGFQAIFADDRVMLLNGGAIRSRAANGFDRDVLAMLRRKAAPATPSAAAEESHAEGAEFESHAESAEGAE